MFPGEEELTQIIEALLLGGGRRDTREGYVKDVTSELVLQGEVGFQQVWERGWGSGTEKPKGVAGQMTFPGLGV